MKREYKDEKQDNNNPSSHNMFAKLHHPPHTHPHPTTSEETDSHPPPPPHHPHDGATIEVVRRPRGRPPGSKNRPKPPLVITNSFSSHSDVNPPMSPYVLELLPGNDVVESTARFCRKRGIGLCILNGHGVVSSVTLKQPSNTNPNSSVVTFHGSFEILSISATILSSSSSSAVGWGGGGSNGPNFALSLAGPQGQVVGGLVVGPLVAAGTVYLIAASFNSPEFHRLGGGDLTTDGGDESTQGGSGGGDVGDQSCGVSAGYNSNFQNNSDVVWAPTARQPPPPPY